MNVPNAISIFNAAIDAVKPAVLIRQQVQWNRPQLIIRDQRIVLKPGGRIFIFGAGKASAQMAEAAEEILGDDLAGGLIITKHDHALPLGKTTVREAGHPVPDKNSIDATHEMLAQVGQLTADDIVLFLLSGGASSLLTDLPGDADLADLQVTYDVLLKSGADIHEMNTIRKHLSAVKGGQLARQIYPATLFTLILSDVIGDNLDVIGSGPTVPDSSSFADALAVLKKYNAADKIPVRIYNHILRGCAGEIPETPKPGNSFEHTFNLIIGNNTMALQAAADKATELGYHPHIITNALRGASAEVGRKLVQEATGNTSLLPACFLYGGETTTQVKGNGLGGRNMELALAAGMELVSYPNITLLSGGTDGSDGPTDAAGAVVTSDIMNELAAMGRAAQSYLDNNDSYHFFSGTDALIKTGPTQTNVMDIVVMLIDTPAF